MNRGASALDQSVLVLNKHYMAVHVIPARRAFCLLFKELAEVITAGDGQFHSHDFRSWRAVSGVAAKLRGPDDDFVRTIYEEIQVPRIVRLLDYDRVPRNKVKFNRRNIFARDMNRCQYCGKKFAAADLSLDHVLPRSRGGAMSWENIVCACVRCNVRKGGRTPTEAAMKLIKPPIKPKASPTLTLKLAHRKYQSWKTFLNEAYWDAELG